MTNIKFYAAALVLMLVIISMSTFVVHERELAIKFKLGEIVESNYSPGLYFQIPVINKVRKFDSRILTLDTPSERFLTAEKKNVILNSFVKWRIVDARTFYTSTLGDERNAINRIASIINDELKGQVGSLQVKEVVSGERSNIMQTVTQNADQKTRELGIC